MPFNFNKAQETVTPAIAINELPQKSGTEALAKVVAGSAQWMAEEFKGKADLESLGNFQGDIQSFEQAIDDLEVPSDLQRLEAVNRLNEIQRNEQTTPEDLVIARQSFAKEIERINLMEQQQGITLESQKRAVVRKRSVIRPDLAPEFQKAIALNKSLLELDRAGPKIDSRFKKFEEQEQLATATGLPVELIQRADRTAKQAAEAKDAYDVKDYAGKAKASDFFQYVNPLVQTNRLAMEALYMEGMRRVRADKSVPRVEIRAEAGPRAVTISVKDNGIGIPKEYREQVFLIFQRLHKHDAYEGTGAGLTIVKKIVESHGGKIWVDSEPGQWTVFTFTLHP